MKLYVDDERPCPEGWVLARSAVEAIGLLDPVFRGEPVEVVSLDHDLGDTEHTPEWTGYTVLEFIEQMTALEPSYNPPEIRIHTANPAGRKKLELGRLAIERLMQKRLET